MPTLSSFLATLTTKLALWQVSLSMFWENNSHGISPYWLLTYREANNATLKPAHGYISIWGLLHRKPVSGAGTSNYIPQCLRDVITCPRPCYLLLAHKSSYLWPNWTHVACRCISAQWSHLLIIISNFPALSDSQPASVQHRAKTRLLSIKFCHSLLWCIKLPVRNDEAKIRPAIILTWHVSLTTWCVFKISNLILLLKVTAANKCYVDRAKNGCRVSK